MDWSPKRQLASRLTDILRSYCQGIDVEGVQANLLTDTRIVLEHVCLAIDGIVGSVESIAFAWKWGDEDALLPISLAICECTLEIRGVKIETGLGFAGNKEGEHPSQKKEGDPENTEDASTRSPTFWENSIDSYVSSLLDSMTVKLLDVEVIVEQELVLSFDSLVLESCGQQASSSLSQRISLDNLAAGCRSSETKILEPFSYSASVNRVDGGKRFSSFLHGLEIIGHQPTNVAKLNIDSLRTLLPLIEKFLRQQQEQQERGNDGSSAVNAPPNVHDATTRFVLPLPDCVILLPNDNIPVTLHATILSYHLDGSVMQVSGHGGLSCNGWPVLRVAEGAVWGLDLVRRSLSLQRDGFVDAVSNEDNENPIVQVEWSAEQWGLPLLQGCLGVRGMLEQFLPTAASTPTVERTTTPSMDLDPWRVSFGGTVLARVKDENENWMQIAIDRPSGIVSQDALEATTEEIRLTSSSGVHVVIPRVRLSDGISVDGVVSCRLRALANLNDAMTLVESELKSALADLDICQPAGLEGLESKNESAAILPAGLRIPQIRFSAEEEGIHVSWDDVVADGVLNEIRFSHVHFADDSGTILSASGFVFSLRDGSAALSAIESLYIPGVASITSPIRSVELQSVLGREMKIYIPSASFMLLDNTGSKGATEGKASPSVPFPVNIYVSEISVESRSRRLAIVYGTQVNLKADGGLQFDGGFKKLETMIVHLHDSSCSGILGIETVYDMRVRPGLIRIGTDISTFDWSLLLSDGGERRPSSVPTVWNLPHVVMESFSIQISLQKDSLSTGKPHRIAAYQVSSILHSYTGV